MARKNILVLYDPRLHLLDDIERIRGELRAIAPELELFVRSGAAEDGALTAYLKARPTLVISFTDFPVHPGWKSTRGGKFFSQRIDKISQLKAVGEAGIPVPAWRRYSAGKAWSESEFGSHIAVKATNTRVSRGAGIGVYETARLESQHQDVLQMLAGLSSPEPIAQRFVNTGDNATSYRVQCFFGQPLYAFSVRKVEALFDGRGALVPEAAITSVSSVEERSFVSEDSVLDLAARAASVFPTRPNVGVDIVRDAKTGKLFVLECNIGNVWNRARRNPVSNARVVALGLPDMMAQFNGYRRIAERLASMAL